MQNSQFERLLKLAQKTGDRLIVTDPSGKEPMVILSLTEYEGLLDYGSFRQNGQNDVLEERSYEDVPKSAPQMTGEGSEMEGEFDPEALEEQVRAAMVLEEPEMVPVEPLSMPSRESGSSVDSVREAADLRPQPPRRPIAPKTMGGEAEEQFYLEPV